MEGKLLRIEVGGQQIEPLRQVSISITKGLFVRITVNDFREAHYRRLGLPAQTKPGQFAPTRWPEKLDTPWKMQRAQDLVPFASMGSGDVHPQCVPVGGRTLFERLSDTSSSQFMLRNQ